MSLWRAKRSIVRFAIAPIYRQVLRRTWQLIRYRTRSSHVRSVTSSLAQSGTWSSTIGHMQIEARNHSNAMSVLVRLCVKLTTQHTWTLIDPLNRKYFFLLHFIGLALQNFQLPPSLSLLISSSWIDSHATHAERDSLENTIGLDIHESTSERRSSLVKFATNDSIVLIISPSIDVCILANVPSRKKCLSSSSLSFINS